MKTLKKTWLRDVLLITLIYFLIHGFILVLTGTFHDDWLSYFMDVTTKDMEGFESGRPYYSYIIELVWNLPGYSYRILVFITYWIIYILTYGTLSYVKGVTRWDALLITIIVIAVPVNDARVLLANYPYALGMMFFYWASFMLTKSISHLNTLGTRLIILLLYALSFTLNSNLVLYGLVLLYLVLAIGFRRIIAISDFIILPIAFYFFNRWFFPVYGAYVDYNLVTFDRIVWAIKSLPEILRNTAISFLRYEFSDIHLVWIALFICTVFLCIEYYLGNRKAHDLKKSQTSKTHQHPNPVNDDTKIENSSPTIFFFGIISLIAGLFPYVVVRQNPDISMVGIQGRDSMQIGLGIALIIYGALNRRMRIGIITFIVVVGIFHFNSWYLNYQTEWYRQLSFQKEVIEIDAIQSGGNFIVDCKNTSSIGDRRFYTWSGNAVAVTGKRNVFMLNGDNDAAILENKKVMELILTHYPMYRDYTMDHLTIDGKMEFNCEISKHDTIRLKFNELFHQDAFNQEIDTIGTMSYSSYTN